MPIKNQRELNILYSSDGINFNRLGKSIEEFNIATDEASTACKNFSTSITDLTGSFELRFKPNMNICYYYIFGKSNNWLRAHGYPMIRRRGKKRNDNQI